jgi:hypothetical protein
VWATPTGSDIVAPRAGDYLFEGQARLGIPVVNQQCYIALANASSGTVPVGLQGGMVIANYDSFGFKTRATALIGQTFRIGFYAPIANITADNRSLYATPVRVS